MPVDPFILVIALVVTLVAATLQGTIGFGVAIVSVPVLSLLDPALTPVPQLLLALPLSAAILWRERHSVDFHGLGWIIAGRVPGALIGLWLLAAFTRREVELAIAVIVLVAVIIFGTGIHIARNRATGFLAGVAAGITGLVASIGGPPIALLFSSSDGPTLRSSLSAVFTIGLSISIIARMATGQISGEDIEVSLLIAPAAAAGLWASTRLKERFDRAMLRLGILVVSGTSALILGIKAIAG